MMIGGQIVVVLEGLGDVAVTEETEDLTITGV